MINAFLKKAAEKALEKHRNQRIFSFMHNGSTYFVKQKLSNGRNRFAKANVAAAFWCEVYKITAVNQYGSFAPSIVLLSENYFVMPDCGAPLQRVAKDQAYECVRNSAFRQAGQTLSQLHEAGLHHGRPALRDIVYDKDKHAITFLDWENEKTFVEASPQDLDIFLFVHSCFRESWKDNHLIDEAMKGYRSICGSCRRLASAKEFTLHHPVLFGLCRGLAIFPWIDIQAANDACAYLQQLL